MSYDSVRYHHSLRATKLLIKPRRKYFVSHFIFIDESLWFFLKQFVEIYTDCSDVNPPSNGVFLITGGGDTPFEAACTSEGWTAIQSRGQFGNPVDYFYRGWDDYVEGFGTPGKNIF